MKRATPLSLRVHRAPIVLCAALALAGCGKTTTTKTTTLDVGAGPGTGPLPDGATGPRADAAAVPNCTASGPEICDGLDNDCNGKIDEGYALRCNACPAPGSCIEAQVTGGAWVEGIVRNLIVGNDRGIALPSLPKRNPYIYVSNSAEDTVSKIRIADAVEVARIRTGNNPSRTAVDGNGDAWVAMRDNLVGTPEGDWDNVIKISGACIPKTKPPTPTRECILLDIPRVGNTLRGVAVDARGDVWIGSYGTQEVVLLDGATGLVKTRVKLPEGSKPYGIAMDENGYLWVASRDGEFHVIRVDPVTLKADIQLDSKKLDYASPYGIAADGKGGIWFGTFGTEIFRVDANTGAHGPSYKVGSSTRGVAVDDAGYIWAADSSLDMALRVDPKDGAVQKFKVGNGPVGVAADHDGNIWTVDESGNSATKLKPDGTLITTVKVGDGPYTYSDMAGSAFRIFKKLRGIFTATYGTGVKGAKWKSATLKGELAPTTKVTLRYRASDGDPKQATWQDATLTGLTAALSATGERIEVEVTLESSDRTAAPSYVENIQLRFER
ncbi:MAG: hypothetical protein IT371_21100 [Deltaproteobacteria bacterium]|nr:hypothetical protein [Deltaproteobacteria bacterium]